MDAIESDPGATRWPYFMQKFYAHTSYDLGQGQQPKNSKLHVAEPYAVAAGKLDPEDDPDDLIFSPIISAQIDSISKHRPSILSLRIQNGKGTDEGKYLALTRRYAGVLFAIFSTFSYSLATLILKLFEQYHPFTISIWRFQGMILPSIPIILYYIFHEKQSVFKGVWPPTESRTLKNIFFITMRSVIGCSSTVLQIYALHYMNMADASVIVYSSPVFVLFVARIFLGEKAGYFAIVIAVFTLVGVAVIARPPLLTGQPIDHNTMLGIVFALACMLTATLVYVILRYLREVHYSVVTLCYGIEGTIQCLILAFAIGAFEFPRSSLEWGLLVGLIMFTWGGQTALILALQLEQCGIVSLINSLDTCFAFVLQFAFLGVVPDKYSLIGASIVVTGVIATTFRKYLANLPEENTTRKRFALILK